MILTRCISSLQEMCIKSLSYDVTVSLISSRTSFSYSSCAEPMIISIKYKTLDFFSPILFTGKCDMLVSKCSGTTLRVFDIKIKKIT